MAILKKPYELSLWRDMWDDTNQWFDEQKICVIGSNDMLSQSRAIEPTLTRNVNGSKKLTFKMYKKYIDTITGETVHNPFVDMLVSESKIKLNYNGKWFDFIIKNIVENSATHLCTYQLEDAFVNELSKNGFNKVLNTDLTNNMGDVNTLASNLLDETDWKVGSTSEKIVQTVEDALVYVTIPAGTRVYHLLDQRENDRTSGITVENEAGVTLENSITALAFYTSCKNKPHRFQFVYSDKGYFTEDGEPLLSRDQERVITESDCQYYCEIDDPATYTVTKHNMILPTGWSFSPQTKDELISSLYRGDRYGFTQQSKYIPEIDRYVYLYKNNKDNKTYYGYQYNEYASATTISDIISNSGFKGSSGWVGHTTEAIGDKKGVNKATVESVYGRFDGGFISLTDDLQKNDYKPDAPGRNYQPYLKFSFQDNAKQEQIVLNSGPYDHRYSIKEMPVGSLWAVRCIDQNGTNLIGNNNLTFELAEYSYNTDTDFLCYQKTDNFVAELVSDDKGYKFEKVDGAIYYFFKVITNNYATETAFTKSSEVRLAIRANNINNATYYIKEIELFRALYTKDATPKLLIPNEKHIDDVVDDIKNQITFSEYRYFTEDAVKGITSEKDLEFTGVETLTYKEFKPVYNAEAEKIRSVEEKESNYFNILQSLAETFECWLDIEVGRDTTGKISRRDDNTLDKNIVFKNYVGQKNYASFRYGVNLKDIQRTYESKNIVTKLVVKTNANEHAPNGFCTIQRAGANTTGENYLYDFGYYHNMGMLDAETYLSIIQDTTNDGEWKGPDLEEDSDEINLKGYNVRISNLNKVIQEENEKLIGLAQDITNISAQKKTAEAMLEAANAGIVEVEADYERVAKQHITATLIPELLDRDDVKSLLVEYGTYISERDKQEDLVAKYAKQYDTLKKEYARLEGLVKDKLEHKKALNTKFYNTYSRFIQEGTWVDEEYIDDDKYYNDAKSVLYNSCYPQVAYNINVLALSMLPGYELLDFDLGDQTNVVDPEFFGEQFQEEVVVTETVESLDDPIKNTIKVQNFKNQFQDLFQKITATVQQAQYSTGAYQKAVSLAYAEDQTKMEFLNDALSSAGAMLTTAGQQSVTWGEDGITVTDVDTPCNELRMIGGAILLSKQDEQTGQKKWVSAVTSDGISANLVTAGVVNTSKIAIMNGNEENFLWDANGINAFGNKVVKTDNSVERPFVRFDKYGLYGIKDKDGAVYRPDSLGTIMDDATFALTWEGLKVTGNSGVEVNIGKQDDSVINITKKDSNENVASIFKITNSGNLELDGTITSDNATITGGSFNVADNFIVDSSGNVTLNGNITWGASASPTQVLYNESGSATKPTGKYSTFVDGTGGWYKTIGTRKYASYTYDGGNTWGPVIKITGDDGDKYEIGPNGNWLLNGSDTGKQALGEDGDPITITGTYYASSSSNTTPGTYGDNGVYPTTLNKDNPYLWTKTTFSDGSHVEQVTQVIMTRDGLFNMLEGEDGIYKDPTDGTIAIKAQAIKTGALLIGSTDNELFYANIETPTVRIAGWGINATELVNGNLKLYGATNNKTTTSLIADGNSKVAIEAGQQTQTKTQQESVTIGSDWIYCTKQETEQSFEYTLSKEYDSVIILSYNPVAEAECPCGQGQVHYVTDRDVQMSCQYDKNTKKIVGKIVSNIFKVLEGGRYQTNIIYMGFYESETTEPTFSLLEDGSMYANAVRLQGLLKSGHVSFNSEESTTTFREPVSYKGASTFVYTGQPVFVTKFSLNDLSKEGTIERINNTSIDDYFSKTNDDDEVVYTIKSGVDFQLSPGDIFHYNKSLSDQSDLSITGFYMNNGVVETTSLGDVLLNGKSLTNTIAKLTQEVYDIKAKVGLL